MSAAAFVLAINIFVAGLFATAFGVVAAYQRPAMGPTWLAIAYGVGMLSPVLEIVLPYQDDHRLVSLAIFSCFLCAQAAWVLGLAHHYRLGRPWLALALMIAGAMLTNVLILDLARDSMLRGMLYQAPYTLMQALGVLVLLGNRNWRPLDLVLLAVLVVSGLHYLGKPLLAAAIGSGASPQSYLTSTYAAYSQSLGAVLLLSTGLVMLLIIVRDMMAEMTMRSETDTLSGLLNRRGFEDRCNKALTQAAFAGVPAVMIVADLDHFKTVNDTYGHAAGDAVIAAFAAVLRSGAAPSSIVGRMGGEEFAIFLPGANLMTGRLYAETARSAFSGLKPGGIAISTPVTASFGIASLRPGDTLSDLLRRADAALYQAKTEGRNRVSLFIEELPRRIWQRGKSA